MDRSLGVTFCVCDGDKPHFERFYAELTRMDMSFAVHFDHCCGETVAKFSKHPLCVGVSKDDDPNSFFDESYRQRSYDELAHHNFERFLAMDPDYTLERDGPDKLRQLCKADWDVAMFRCIDLWGDGRHQRVDGTFGHGTREMCFRAKGNRVHYEGPTLHAPYLYPPSGDRYAVKVIKPDICVLHWGIMNMDDARFHRDRWDVIYKRRVNRNPYAGFYDYLCDPATEIRVAEVPKELLCE